MVHMQIVFLRILFLRRAPRPWIKKPNDGNKRTTWCCTHIERCEHNRFKLSPKRFPKMLHFSLSLSVLWAASWSNLCAFFVRWQPSWNPSRIAKMAIRSIRLSNGCQVCCQKEIYQSNLQTMLIYAIFNTFWGVRRSRPKTVFHAQK